MTSKSNIWVASIVCFVITLAIYISLNGYLNTKYPNDKWATAILEIVSSLGVYTIIFHLYLFIYEKYLFVMIDKRFDMTGEWFQVFIIKNPADGVASIRHGYCSIKASPNGINLSAENYRPDDTFSSNWQSEVTTIINNQLYVMFVSQGNRPTNPITRGTMVFNIHGCPPNRLIGTFNDSTPATHSGEIRIFREYDEYCQYLNSFQVDGVPDIPSRLDQGE